jgi:hypothetical protein
VRLPRIRSEAPAFDLHWPPEEPRDLPNPGAAKVLGGPDVKDEPRS